MQGQTATHRICTMRDRKSKDLILEMTCKKISTLKFTNNESIISLTSHPYINNQIWSARTLINQKIVGRSFLWDNAILRLGNHSCTQIYHDLNLGKLLEYTYAPKCQAILNLPELTL